MIQDGRKYRLVLPNGLGDFIERLPPNTYVPVLVLATQKKADMKVFRTLQLQAAFLQKIVYALGLSLATDSVMTLWAAMNKQDLIQLSPDLGTKNGLSRITGLNRRIKPGHPINVASTFKKDELREGVGDVD